MDNSYNYSVPSMAPHVFSDITWLSSFLLFLCVKLNIHLLFYIFYYYYHYNYCYYYYIYYIGLNGRPSQMFISPSVALLAKSLDTPALDPCPHHSLNLLKSYNEEIGLDDDNLDVPEKSSLVIPSGTVVLIIQEADWWFRTYPNLSSKTVVYRSVLGIVTWMKDSNRFQSFPGS